MADASTVGRGVLFLIFGIIMLAYTIKNVIKNRKNLKTKDYVIMVSTAVIVLIATMLLYNSLG